MSLLKSRPQQAAATTETTEDTLRRLAGEAMQLRQQLHEVTQERDNALALLEGNVPQAARWLMAKVARQRQELERRCLTSYARRLVLRAFAEAGHQLTDAQWAYIRAQIADERLRQRAAALLPKAARITD